MQIYHYDPVTGEFGATGAAEESPLEPGAYLIPAHATDKPVPTLESGEVAVFANNKWRVVVDYRNRQVCALDEHGYYAGPAALALGESPDARRILTDPPNASIKKPKWSGKEWIDGRSTEEVEADALASVKAAAQEALDKCDRTALRCFKANVVWPVEWKDYDAALRSIVNGKSKATALPATPKYPAGS